MTPWILMVLVGAALSALVYFSVPGRIRGGLLLTMLVGAIGALGMAWVGKQVGLATPGQSLGFFAAVIGTALVLAIWRTAMGRA